MINAIRKAWREMSAWFQVGLTSLIAGSLMLYGLLMFNLLRRSQIEALVGVNIGLLIFVGLVSLMIGWLVS